MEIKLELSSKLDIHDCVLNDDTYSKTLQLGKLIGIFQKQNIEHAISSKIGRAHV